MVIFFLGPLAAKQECYPLCYAVPHPNELIESKLFGFRKTFNGNWPPYGSYGWHPLVSMVRKSQKPARHIYKHQPLLCCHAVFEVFAFVPSNAFIVTILYKWFSLYHLKIFNIFQVEIGMIGFACFYCSNNLRYKIKNIIQKYIVQFRFRSRSELRSFQSSQQTGL